MACYIRYKKMSRCAPRSTMSSTVRVSEMYRAFYGSKRGGILFRYTLKQAKKNPLALLKYHDLEGNNVLHHCALRKAVTDVQSLMNSIAVSRFERLENCSSVNARGQTALHIAVLNGDTAMIQILLRCGVNPLVRDKKGYTCIHYACMQHDYQSMIEVLRILLLWDPQLLSVTSEDGKTPLMIAVQIRNIILIRTILSHLVTFTKYTPILSDEAATPRQSLTSPFGQYFRRGNLIEHFQPTTRDSLTVFHIATINRDASIVRLLLEVSGITEFTYSSIGYLPIHYACQNGDVDTIMALHSVDPELIGSLERSRTREKRTYPLHLVVASGAQKAVQFVLCHGGSFACNIQDHNKRTPIHYAALQGSSTLVQMLLKFGCDPSIEDIKGQTPIDIALQKNNQVCVNVLHKFLYRDMAHCN